MSAMPGLRRQPGISVYTNSLYHADMHNSWDREQRSIVSCRPVPLNTRWLKQGRENKHNYLGTKTAVSSTPVPVRYGSNESDDLQAMVHDFIENDSLDCMDGTDSDGPAPAKKLIETLQALIAPGSALERELVKEVKLQLLSIKDLVCESEGSDCKGGCVKRFVVNHLNVTGYDAAVCKCKWLSSGRVPGGEYEYIDVVFDGNHLAERLIVDVDFKAQFEIARPTQQYEAALKILPPVFVGSTFKLEQILQFMSEAAKASLKQSDMHLPPWRTLDYMSSKWLSTYERKRMDAVYPVLPAKRHRSYHHWQENTNNNNNTNSYIASVAKQCSEQLRHTKASLIAEMKSSEVVSNLTHGRSSRAILLPRTVM